KQLGSQAEQLQQEIAKAAKTDPTKQEALQRQLDALRARQNEVNKKLNQLAERMDTFVRKDPVYDIEAELQQTLEEKAEAIRQSTQANDAAAKSVAQKSAPPAGSRAVTPEMLQQFKEASDEQVAKLGGAEQE